MIIQSKSSDIFSGIYNITSPSTSVKLVQAHAHTQTEKKYVTLPLFLFTKYTLTTVWNT